MNFEYDSIKKLNNKKDLVLFITTKKNPLDSILKKIKKNSEKKEFQNTSNLVLTLYPNSSNIESKNNNLDITILHIPTFQITNRNEYTRHISKLERYKKSLEKKFNLKYFEPIKIEHVKGIWVPISFLFNVRSFLFKNMKTYNIKECFIITYNIRSGLYIKTRIEKLIRRKFKVKMIRENLILYYFFFIRDLSYQFISFFLKIFVFIRNSFDFKEIKKQIRPKVNLLPIQIESNLNQRIFSRLDTLMISTYSNYEPFIFTLTTANRFITYKNSKIKVFNILKFNFPLFVSCIIKLNFMLLLDLFSGKLIVSSIFYNFISIYINEKSIKSNYLEFFRNHIYSNLPFCIWGDGFLAEGDIISKINLFKKSNFNYISLTSKTFIWIEYVSKIYINSLTCLTISSISKDILKNNFLSNIKIESLFQEDLLSNSKGLKKNLGYKKLVLIDLPNYQLHPSWVSFAELLNFKILISKLERVDNVILIVKPHPSFKNLTNFWKSYRYLIKNKLVLVQDPKHNIDKLIANYFDYKIFFITRNSTLSNQFLYQGIDTFILSNDFLNIQSQAFNNQIYISNNIEHIIKMISCK